MNSGGGRLVVSQSIYDKLNLDFDFLFFIEKKRNKKF